MNPHNPTLNEMRAAAAASLAVTRAIRGSPCRNPKITVPRQKADRSTAMLVALQRALQTTPKFVTMQVLSSTYLRPAIAETLRRLGVKVPKLPRDNFSLMHYVANLPPDQKARVEAEMNQRLDNLRRSQRESWDFHKRVYDDRVRRLQHVTAKPPPRVGDVVTLQRTTKQYCLSACGPDDTVAQQYQTGGVQGTLRAVSDWELGVEVGGEVVPLAWDESQLVFVGNHRRADDGVYSQYELEA